MNEVIIAGGSVSLITGIIVELVVKRSLQLEARWIPTATVLVAESFTLANYWAQAVQTRVGLLDSIVLGLFSAAVTMGIYSGAKSSLNK